VGYITAGNMKEPFSLETLTGSADITFMERSLPTVTFSPSYNLGVRSTTRPPQSNELGNRRILEHAEFE